MSKELFEKMREEEMYQDMYKYDNRLSTIIENKINYDPTFSKQQAQMQGNELANELLENLNADDAVTRLARLTEVLNTAFANVKDKLEIDKETTINGVKLKHVEGGAQYDFSKDATWSHLNEKIKKLKNDLKFREKQLIQASKEEVISEDGEIIEQVPIKGYRKSYIRITY